MTNGPIKALADLWQLYATEPFSEPIEATFASLSSDPVLAGGVRRGVDDSPPIDPMVEGERRVAASRLA